ncbi:hypothetical protein BGZ59_002991 [Podila verticillata]|nr:hypothetical protein BGZ59_002991 [Podila verticillata]
MALAQKQPASTIAASLADPNASSKSTRTQPQSASAALVKRKPVKPTAASVFSNSDIKSSRTSTSSTGERSQHSTLNTTSPSVSVNAHQREFVSDSSGRGQGMAAQRAKTFQESQDELFLKLENLAAVKTKVSPLDKGPPGSVSTSQRAMKQTTGFSPITPTRMNPNNNYNNNKSITFNQGQAKQAVGNSSVASLKPLVRRSSTSFQQQSNGYGSGGAQSGGMSMTYNPPTPERPRQPRRRINSAQFKTPSTVEMAELAQIVVANASPPKIQNKLRKRASTLSLTTTTFMPPMIQNPVIVAMTPNGGHEVPDFDFRQRYDAALKDAKIWEKKYSSVQHQLHYEREKWEEKYGELERMLHNQESIKTETNVDKMNSLLDTVEQLQMANEAFRKQLMDAGIEPDPTPAVTYHSHHLLMDENEDRTVLEENELIKEKSLITNQKIAHLSSEINNAAIAISQTINYVQLRYLTQMLDAAEHVSTQKRTRVMSNSFLSDMLSRGVKKAGPLQAKNTTSIATQTPTDLQVGSSNPLENKQNKSFSFTSSLLNLAGLNSHPSEMQYRLKGGATDDRSQLIHCRPGIPPVIVQELKGSPKSPEAIDLLAQSRVNTPLPKFQYASPTTSQLRIFVPDGFSHRTASSVSSGSQNGSILNGYSSGGGSLRRSSSEISLLMSGQSPRQSPNSGLVRTGGKYPYPYNYSSRPSSQKSMTNTSLHRAMSQQFLTPETAIHHSHNSLDRPMS